MNIAKTVLIYAEIPENIRFLVVDGDKRHLEGVFINSYTEDVRQENLQDELSTLVHDEDGYLRKELMVEKFPTDLVKEGETAVILCGFYL